MDFVKRLEASLNYNLMVARLNGDMPNPINNGRCIPCLTAVESNNCGTFGVGRKPRTVYVPNFFEGAPWGSMTVRWNGREYVPNV